MNQKKVLVSGAGGFIGHHLVSYLKKQGYWVRGVDIKLPEFAPTDADQFELLDLRDWANCLQATRQVHEVYSLAADMGGMGFISNYNARIISNNTRISFNMIEAARINGAERIFFSSSACVYPKNKQTMTDVTPLKEEDAIPAEPEDAYGWEKLLTERVYIYYKNDYGFNTRIARFHNIFGPLGTWEGGREKAPAALCRKVAIAKLTGNMEIEIWGDGNQTRSFCYIDDCVEGIYRLMQSDYVEPLNIGSDYMVTINQLAEIISAAAGVQIVKKHIPGPQGVRGRNSDNTRLRNVLGWEPQISLKEGLSHTYAWIAEEVRKRLAQHLTPEAPTILAQSVLPEKRERAINS
jgi:nucleoside-diphosphate-sugar epimerase